MSELSSQPAKRFQAGRRMLYLQLPKSELFTSLRAAVRGCMLVQHPNTCQNVLNSTFQPGCSHPDRSGTQQVILPLLATWKKAKSAAMRTSLKGFRLYRKHVPSGIWIYWKQSTSAQGHLFCAARKSMFVTCCLLELMNVVYHSANINKLCDLWW